VREGKKVTQDEDGGLTEARSTDPFKSVLKH
jgi:hypothetical protein